MAPNITWQFLITDIYLCITENLWMFQLNTNSKKDYFFLWFFKIVNIKDIFKIKSAVDIGLQSTLTYINWKIEYVYISVLKEIFAVMRLLWTCKIFLQAKKSLLKVYALTTKIKKSKRFKGNDIQFKKKSCEYIRTQWSLHHCMINIYIVNDEILF